MRYSAAESCRVPRCRTPLWTQCRDGGRDQAISIVHCGPLHVQTAVSVRGADDRDDCVVRQAGRTRYGLPINHRLEPPEPVMKIQKPPQQTQTNDRTTPSAKSEPNTDTTTNPGDRST